MRRVVDVIMELDVGLSERDLLTRVGLFRLGVWI